jgi:branched-chain amino acid transport system permease protein
VVPAASGVAVALAAVLVMLGLGGSYQGSTFTVALGFAVVTIGMAIQLGYSHQLAFSQSAFMGLGAYTVAVLEVKYSVGIAVAMVAAIVLSAVVSLLVGSVLTRVAGLALALTTLLIPKLLYDVATFSGYLGRFSGVSGVQPLWNADNYRVSLVGTGVVAALILGLVTFLALQVLRSKVGLQLAAVASDEGMAEGLGVNLRQRKLEVFVLGSVLAALGGAIVAAAQSVVTPDVLAEQSQLTLLVMLFIGGRKSVWGAIAGAIGIEFLSSLSDAITSNLPVIEGVLLLIVLLFEPDGFAGIVVRIARAVGRLVSRAGPEEPGTEGGTTASAVGPEVARVGGGDGRD